MPGKDSLKVTVSGTGLKVDREISEEQARAILNIVMGGSGPALPAQAPLPDGAPSTPSPDLAPGQTSKQFFLAKQPKSDLERVACLAFWLTHVKKTSTFKAKDLAELAREACPGQLPHPSVALNNATRDGYVAAAGAGSKQITARGEALVAALPDREAVARALEAHPVRKARKRKNKKKASAS